MVKISLQGLLETRKRLQFEVKEGLLCPKNHRPSLKGISKQAPVSFHADGCLSFKSKKSLFIPQNFYLFQTHLHVHAL